MSYIESKHGAVVVVSIDDQNLKSGRYLKAVEDWLYWQYFGPMHFSYNDDGPRISDMLMDIHREKLNSAKRRVWTEQCKATVDIDHVCQLKITGFERPRDCYTISFLDFKDKPHMKCARSFVDVLHGGNSHAYCGLLHTEVTSHTEFERQLVINGYGYERPTIAIHPANHLHALKMFVSTYLHEPEMVAQVVDGAITALSSGEIFTFEMPGDVLIEISLQNVERVVNTHLDSMGYWRKWLVEPKMERDFEAGKAADALRPSKVAFFVRVTPTKEYDIKRHCHPTYGPNLVGIANTITNLINIAGIG